MYGINEKLFIAGLCVLFVTVVIGGIFSSQVAVLWLRNKREQRRHDDRNREEDRVDRLEAERNAWVSVMTEKDKLIINLTKELDEMTNQYERAKERMSKFNIKGELIDGTNH